MEEKYRITVHDDAKAFVWKVKHLYPQLGRHLPKYPDHAYAPQGARRKCWHDPFFSLVHQLEVNGEQVKRAVALARVEFERNAQSAPSIWAAIQAVEADSLRKQYYAWRKHLQEGRPPQTLFRRRDVLVELIGGSNDRAGEMFETLGKASKRKVIEVLC